MNKNKILDAIKQSYSEVVNNDETLTHQEKATLTSNLDEVFSPDAPLSQLGWDSLKLTWFMVRLEEKLDIDTANISLYNLHTFNDLINAISQQCHVVSENG